MLSTAPIDFSGVLPKSTPIRITLGILDGQPRLSLSGTEWMGGKEVQCGSGEWSVLLTTVLISPCIYMYSPSICLLYQ